MRFILMIVLLISAISCKEKAFSQEMSTEFCKGIKQLDLSNSSAENILKDMTQLSLDLRNNNPDKVKSIRNKIAQQIGTDNEVEVAYAFAVKFTGDLMENCPEYLTAVRKILPQKIDSNATVGYVSSKVESFLKEWQNEPLDKKYEMATDSVITYLGFCANYRENYPNLSYGDLSPQNDVHVYLLHNSDDYLKAFLVNTQLKGMGYDAVEFPRMPEITFRIIE